MRERSAPCHSERSGPPTPFGAGQNKSKLLDRRRRTMVILGNFDISDLWLETDYALERYVGEPLTDALLSFN
jgi:hypothetical protein